VLACTSLSLASRAQQPRERPTEQQSQQSEAQSPEENRDTSAPKFDPVEYPFHGFLAGISQPENSESDHGQGAAGYGKRFGSNFADGTTEKFFAQASFPSLFRQDSRYYQDGKGTFWRRAGYAVGRIAL
jgi:hypothetical protein